MFRDEGSLLSKETSVSWSVKRDQSSEDNPPCPRTSRAQQAVTTSERCCVKDRNTAVEATEAWRGEKGPRCTQCRRDQGRRSGAHRRGRLGQGGGFQLWHRAGLSLQKVPVTKHYIRENLRVCAVE